MTSTASLPTAAHAEQIFATDAHRRQRRARAAGLGLLVVAALIMSACGSTKVSNASSGASAGTSASTSSRSVASKGTSAKVTIGFLSYWEGADPFAVALTKATLAEGQKLGVTIDYVNGNNTLSTQIAAIQTFITKRVNAIVVFPGSTTALVPIVNKAAGAGIPVIDLNERLASSAKITTYVGDNDYTYGELEARMLVKALGGHGTFALAQGTLGTAAQIDRTAGIKHVLAGYPNIHMVATESDSFEAAKALALTQDWATKYPNLNAIVVEGPEGVTGAEWAAAHGHKGIKFILGDYPTYVRPAIQDGEVYGTVDQSPVLEAQDSVIAAYDIVTGHSSKVPKPAWYVSLPLVTKANVSAVKPAW